MKIGLVDIDGHAKKKKWGATIPELNLSNRLIRFHDELTVKAVKYGIGTPEKYIKGYSYYLHLLYLGREGIRKQQCKNHRPTMLSGVLRSRQ